MSDAASSADHQQRQGVAWDILAEAIETFDAWMLDDDYDADTKLKQIINRMRERRALIGPAMDEAGIKAVVDEQAHDESLWFVPVTITEDILQRALRRLHEVIEGKTSVERAIEILKEAR